MATITHSSRPASRAADARSPVLKQGLWLLGAAILGYGISALFSGVLRFPRSWFVAAYLVIASAFLFGYVRSSRIDLHQLLRRNWKRGMAGAVIVGAFMTWSMQRQPDSPPPEGIGLPLALAWLGLVYGLVDGLLLNVMPVLATQRAFEARGWTRSILGRVAAGATGLASSLAVTAAYHLGFVEYRGPDLGAPLFGNGIFTLGYILTGNPIAAVAAHVVLHVASALHGIDTTVTLPPHY